MLTYKRVLLLLLLDKSIADVATHSNSQLIFDNMIHDD